MLSIQQSMRFQSLYVFGRELLRWSYQRVEEDAKPAEPRTQMSQDNYKCLDLAYEIYRAFQTNQVQILIELNLKETGPRRQEIAR